MHRLVELKASATWSRYRIVDGRAFGAVAAVSKRRAHVLEVNVTTRYYKSWVGPGAPVVPRVHVHMLNCAACDRTRRAWQTQLPACGRRCRALGDRGRGELCCGSNVAIVDGRVRRVGRHGNPGPARRSRAPTNRPRSTMLHPKSALSRVSREWASKHHTNWCDIQAAIKIPDPAAGSALLRWTFIPGGTNYMNASSILQCMQVLGLAPPAERLTATHASLHDANACSHSIMLHRWPPPAAVSPFNRFSSGPWWSSQRHSLQRGPASMGSAPDDVCSAHFDVIMSSPP